MDAAALEAADVLNVLQAEIRPTRMRCVTLPVVRAGPGAQRDQARMRLDEHDAPGFPDPAADRERPSARLPRLAAHRARSPARVIEAMNRYYERSHANVHRSIHTLGEEATELYELARDSVQRFIGAASREEVVFTRGTTDGLGLIAETIGRTLAKGDEIIVTELEHHSNLIPWQLVARDRGASSQGRARFSLTARWTSAALDRLITRRTRVVAFAHVSNVLGTITPVAEIVRRARAVDAISVVDGAQAAPHLQARHVRARDVTSTCSRPTRCSGPPGSASCTAGEPCSIVWSPGAAAAR